MYLAKHMHTFLYIMTIIKFWRFLWISGPSPKKDIQTDKNVPREHAGKQEPGNTKTSIENGNFRIQTINIKKI